MKTRRIKEQGLGSLGVLLVVVLWGCASPPSTENDVQGNNLTRNTEGQVITEEKVKGHGATMPFVRSRRFIKTTQERCLVRGGEYFEHKDILPQDMVDCILPGQVRQLGGGRTYSTPREILGSVYDYLYRTAVEKPKYGLYSYVLLPIHSPRTDPFLEELFKTTSFVELTQITTQHLNIMYLPTKEDKLSSLIPMVSDGSPPRTQIFSQQFYDYPFARRLLAQICSSPPDEIREICETDLSRGPYLFTFTKPISDLTPVPPPYLFVDLSSVHQKAFPEFIAAYKEQVKRPDYSDLKRINNFRIKVLSIILTATDWIGSIKGAIADIVHMAK